MNRLSRFEELWVLLTIEMSSWRWSWRNMIVTNAVGPIVTMFTLLAFARQNGEQDTEFVATGVVIIAVLFGTLDKSQVRVNYMRATGAIEAISMLPIRSQNLMLAIVISFSLLALPGIVLTMVFGMVAADLSPGWGLLLLIPVIPLVTIPMSLLGTLIGARATSLPQGSAYALLLTLVLVVGGQVLLPADRVPSLVSLGSWLLPSTYAASALRQCLLSEIGTRLILDLVLLGLFAVVTFTAVRRMSFRSYATPGRA